MTDLLERADAVISDCGRYRYRLERQWSEGPKMTFIMLNPSTADHQIDDPTIRRCRNFAKREGCGGFVVINLMAWRATKPDDLPVDAAAIGPDNLLHHDIALDEADGPIVVAWGSNKRATPFGDDTLRRIARKGLDAYALKLSKSGAPWHPLYVKGDAPLIPMFGPTEERS